MWLLLCLCALAYAQDELRVNTTQGVVIGTRVADGNFLSFYGIHYAGSTAGENRFKAPFPPASYPGDYYAVDNNIICAQPSPRGLIGVEDCLVLNIHTKRNLTTLQPVFVWIEGEEYESSSKTLYPVKNLLQQNLVVVSINYRLSIFGFLCLGVPDAPGNAGLKDIIQGLKWIKENIAGFGGDPNNVMLVGHGSGAAMVDLVTLSPMSQNLTHKAIVLSGSALAPWAVSYDPIGYAEAVGEKLGYGGKTRDELAKKLVSTDISLFSGVLSDFEFYNNTPLFAPCIEDAKLGGTFLSDSPINLLRTGKYNHIPYITGYTDREGTLRALEASYSNWLPKMNDNFGDFIQVDLKFESELNRNNVTRSIREFYFDQRAVNMETIEDYLDYQGDSLILIPVVRGAKERAATSQADVWLFKFAVKGTQNSDWAFPQIPLTGARHGIIINFLFDYDLRISDESARTAITRRFATFAYTGSAVQSSPDPGTTWPPVTSTWQNMLLMSGGEVAVNVSIYKEEMSLNLNKESTDFWDPILASHYRAPVPVGSSAEGLFTFGLVIIASQVLVNLFK